MKWNGEDVTDGITYRIYKWEEGRKESLTVYINERKEGRKEGITHRIYKWEEGRRERRNHLPYI